MCVLYVLVVVMVVVSEPPAVLSGWCEFGWVVIPTGEQQAVEGETKLE